MDRPGAEHADHGRRSGFVETLHELFRDAVRFGATPDLLERVLGAAMRFVNGTRAFLALVDRETAEMTVACTAGDGWTEEGKRLRLHLAQETNRGITGHVAITSQPYVTGDTSRDPYYLPFFSDAISEIAVPVLGMTGHAAGVINVESNVPNAFDSQDCARLVAIAQAASVALGLDGFRARETALIEIGTSLNTTLETGALMRKVVDEAAEALKYEGCSVFLLDPNTNRLVLRASHRALAEGVGVASYALGEGITGWVAMHGAPQRLDHPQQDPRWVGRHTEMPADQIGALLVVPIISRDRVIGVLRVVRSRSHSPWFSNRFTEADERVLTTIASQLGSALENAASFQRLVRAERMAAWGELSAKSAHMIGNRTFALKGDLNELRHLLETGSREGCAEELELVASMERGIARLEEILREFRDFVMATQITLADADINQAIREVVAEFCPRRSAVALEMDLAEDLPPVRCDVAKLKRAFAELVENAISFQPQGGGLRVASRRVPPEERLGARLAPGRAYIEVQFADSGPGVPEELKSRIFQPFFTSRTKGMGLGLSIVKGIVDAHHGLLREVGGVGEGARFVIILPVRGR
ncbi:MAG TPA: GAF domain-containing protein [Chthonomonadales bacterium]|nr:GAF domain-containing protein [Chthonomonadales bacterium]